MAVVESSERAAQRLMRRVGTWKDYVISLVVMLVIWEALSRVLPGYVLPPLEAVFETILNLNFVHVYVTLLRVAVALLASFAAGLALATIMYLSKRAERYLMPIVSLVMAVPAICWVLFAILWFREQEFRVFFVLFAVCMPGYTIDILDGIKSVPYQLREVMLVFRPTRYQLLRKLIFPSILPNVLTTWKVNLGLGIRVVTVAELVGTLTGVGYALNFALGNLSIREIMAWTVVLVASLLALQGLVYLIESWALRWRR
ncbi:MAG: ABC transporter permease subunit [Aigarchaeota archaeon]|nr:ABC transporter permease subunit [Candidatus Calditenuis fumarioli]